MTGLLIAVGILAFFVFLFTVPIHLFIGLDGDVYVYLRVLFVRIPLYPASRRKRRAKKKKSGAKRVKSVKKQKKGASKSEKPKGKRDIRSMLRFVFRIVLAVLRKTSHHLRIRVCTYRIDVATGDAAKTAILYGAVAGLSSNLFEALKSVANFKVKRSADVDVTANFVGEKTIAKVKLDLFVNLWSVLVLLLAAGLAFVKNKNQTAA